MKRYITNWPGESQNTTYKLLQLEEIIEGILLVHAEMDEHCTKFASDTQPRIMHLARHISGYYSNAEVC